MQQARPGDHLSKVAFLAGMDVGKLLMDNLDVIPSLDRPLAGTRLRLCGIDTRELVWSRSCRHKQRGKCAKEMGRGGGGVESGRTGWLNADGRGGCMVEFKHHAMPTWGQQGCCTPC
jgi:hypothetical protein